MWDVSLYVSKVVLDKNNTNIFNEIENARKVLNPSITPWFKLLFSIITKKKVLKDMFMVIKAKIYATSIRWIKKVLKC